jgi:hypothetical protein
MRAVAVGSTGNTESLIAAAAEKHSDRIASQDCVQARLGNTSATTTHF